MGTRRRLLVGLAGIGVALVVAVVLGASSIWNHSSSSRQAVARYVTDVGAVQQEMRLPLDRMRAAYREFATGGKSGESAARLAAAERTLQTLERRLAGLPAPPDAARLRTLLLALVRQEVAVAGELHRLALFLPRFEAVAAAATTADRLLARRIAAATPPKPQAVRDTGGQAAQAQAALLAAATRAAAAQADALRAYERTLARLVRELDLLRPPPVMAPAYRTELRRLRATRRVAAALAAELRKQDRRRAPELGRALTQALRLSGSLAAQRSQIAAVQAYDARVRRIDKTKAQVENELKRLQRELD